MTTTPRMVHVVNAPSPAATASLAIGRHVAGTMSGLAQQSWKANDVMRP